MEFFESQFSSVPPIEINQFILFQVWFQNRRAKFRKQERLAQQKVSSNGSTGDQAKQHSQQHQQQQQNSQQQQQNSQQQQTSVKTEIKSSSGAAGVGASHLGGHLPGSVGSGSGSIKDVKPGSPGSGLSTTPNSNTSASSLQSNGDVKPVNGKIIIIYNKYSISLVVST